MEIVGVVAVAVTWPASGSRPHFCELSPRLSCRSLPGAPAAPRAQRPSPSPLLLNHHSSKAGSGHRPGLLGILVVTSPFSSGVSPTEAGDRGYLLFLNHNFFHPPPQVQSRRWARGHSQAALLGFPNLV